MQECLKGRFLPLQVGERVGFGARSGCALFPVPWSESKKVFPATGSGVEREFSISGNIVNNRRNRLSPKTISDIMQYKRWMARTGVVTKLLKNQEDASIMETELER